MITIAVLAVQGAFIEHEHRLTRLGCRVVELRQATDLEQDFDGLVLPGGESTVQSKLLHELGMFEKLQCRIDDGLAVLGTCAGAILLAATIEDGRASGEREAGSVSGFRSIAMTVRRNAYGRQLGSFHAEGEFCTSGADGLGDADGGHEGRKLIPLTFIRAPRIVDVSSNVETLVVLNGEPVAVRYDKQIACTFHPELDDDDSIYELFLSLV